MPPTIGVFDSGFGGLTVLRAMLPLMRGAHFIYLGDTARLPYGAKSQATIARFAVESARFLASRGADLLVIACNTATALALHEIRIAVDIPVVGVIEPAIHEARQRADAPDVLVLATQATVHSHAYREACAQNGLRATEKACPLLVPLVEEGWVDHPVTRDVLRIYLEDALADCNPGTVLLGCTHYPLIAEPIRSTLRDLGSEAVVVDSAQATAQAVRSLIADDPHATSPASFECFATDSISKFQHLGSQFLQQEIPNVQLLDLGG